MYWQKNDAKFRALAQNATYDQFEEIVKASHIKPLGNYKRYFIIDQQIARHLVSYSICLYQPPLPFYVTQIINPFLASTMSANHDKGLEF